MRVGTEREYHGFSGAFTGSKKRYKQGFVYTDLELRGVIQTKDKICESDCKDCNYSSGNK